MAEVIYMPALSDTMKEGVVAVWHKKVGDKVVSGDLLAEIESDKATMEFEATTKGVLLYHAEAGKAVPVNTGILAIIGQEKEDISAYLNPTSVTTIAQTTQESDTTTTTISPTEEQSIQNDNDRLKASPLAKKMAEIGRIDLANISGSGDEGRIVKRDVEAYLQKNVPIVDTKIVEVKPITQEHLPVPPPVELPLITATVATTTTTIVDNERQAWSYVGNEQYQESTINSMRKTIARRLTESKNTAPHFYLTISINMEAATAFRQELNAMGDIKISFNDIVIKASAMALRQHPAVNSSWLGDTIRQNHHIHIGMAVAVENGLVVPVIKFADNKSLGQIATEARELGTKSRDRKLQTTEMQGNTFTISNLGMFDIDEFTAIINPPDACILAVGSIKAQAVVVNGEVKAQQMMKLTLSCDHRVVDGATGAKFLQSLKKMLENPMALMI